MEQQAIQSSNETKRSPVSAWVAFSRRQDLRGVEIRTVHAELGFCGDNCAGYSSDFEFLGPVSFCGEIWHRQRWLVVSPGWLLAGSPGEVFVGRRVLSAGAFSSLSFDAEALGDYLAEHELTLSQLKLRPHVRMTAVLRARFLAVIDSFNPDLSLLDAEEAVTAFVAAMVREVVMDSPAESALPAAASSIADHVREQLHQDTLGRLDLTTLAQEAGLSRYQVLRAFKRRYGLPPQSYRMRVRMAIAQRMLREGAAPAFVAAELGFVDQSHLTRHFKRVLGVTPAVYARSQVPGHAAGSAERGWWRTASSSGPRTTSESGVHVLPTAIAAAR